VSKGKGGKKEKLMALATFSTVAVDNPFAMPVHETRHRRGETIYRMPQVEVAISQRDRDQLGAMYRRRQIGKASLNAGRLYQTTYETAHGLRGRSPGDLREFVDGGRLPSTGTTDAQMRASDRLVFWDAHLGTDAELIVAFLIHKCSTREIADSSTTMMPGKASTTFHGWLIRRILARLAKAMGLA
jgi:hypothetical protein